MGLHIGACYETTQLENYKRARLHLLKLFIYLDKILPNGPKKEQILSELVDNDHAMQFALVRG